MAFDGTMGVFLIGSIIWMTAILLDRNRVLPKWFACLNLCNALLARHTCRYPRRMRSQAHLGLAAGVINTLILLFSSWSMARCVQAAREGAVAAARRDLLLTAAFALAFVVVKLTE
jgi:heme/copper-type cytochrome/quinol oxidase subunit 3